MRSIVFLFSITVLVGCSSTSQPVSHGQKRLLFTNEAYHRVRGPLSRFFDREDGYGKVARSLRISQKNYKEIKNEILSTGLCKKTMGAIRDPKTKEKKMWKGEEILMVFFHCQDASLIRVKVEGNPTDPYHPEPHLTKSVLLREGLSFNDFDNEAFKVDEQGWPQPKWPQDLKKEADVKEWSAKTHLPLKNPHLN